MVFFMAKHEKLDDSDLFERMEKDSKKNKNNIKELLDKLKRE